MPRGPLLCHHRGFLHALTEISRREGFRVGFFSGLWPTVAKGALNNCIRFGLYNEAATVVRKARGDAPDKPLGPGMTFTLGAAAGAVSAVSGDPVLFCLALLTFALLAGYHCSPHAQSIARLVCFAVILKLSCLVLRFRKITL